MFPKTFWPIAILLLCLITACGEHPTAPGIPGAPTSTPWPAAPPITAPPQPLVCANGILAVTLSWSMPQSAHPVAQYYLSIESRRNAGQSWEVAYTRETSTPFVTASLPCTEAAAFRWRVHATDVRGSIGPWSDYSEFTAGSTAFSNTSTPTPTPCARHWFFSFSPGQDDATCPAEVISTPASGQDFEGDECCSITATEKTVWILFGLSITTVPGMSNILTAWP